MSGRVSGRQYGSLLPRDQRPARFFHKLTPGHASFRRAWQCRTAGRFSLAAGLDLASGARPPIYNAAMDNADTLPGPSLPAFEPGWVWLAGAGPGDPGLLTLLALHGLRHADIIVYDALVGPGVLALARPGAALEYAGKRGGKPSARQPDISLRLVQLAREGKLVLRLKGGDPFVFGRGGEEAMALVAAGIPFRIVPGISAGIGGLAYAGIPVTHRDINSAVTFITGHDTSGLVPDSVDWVSLARGSPGLVIHLGPPTIATH